MSVVGCSVIIGMVSCHRTRPRQCSLRLPQTPYRSGNDRGFVASPGRTIEPRSGRIVWAARTPQKPHEINVFRKAETLFAMLPRAPAGAELDSRPFDLPRALAGAPPECPEPLPRVCPFCELFEQNQAHYRDSG